MMYRPQRILSGAAAVTATALLASSGIAFAQEESPTTEDPASMNGEAEGSAQAHPLHIHDGSCDQLGDVIFPLGEISTDLMIHNEAVGGAEDQEVALNLTLVAATLGDLTSAPHAINIHQSEEDMDTHLACGDITGSIIDGDTLVIRLDELDGSGYLGFALLREEPEPTDDGQVATAVYSMLTEKDASMPAPTDPAAGDDPAAESPAAEDPAMSPPPADDSAAESPATESPAADDPAMSPAPEDEAATDGATVTVEVEVDGEGVDVEVDDGAQESPAA